VRKENSQFVTKKNVVRKRKVQKIILKAFTSKNPEKHGVDDISTFSEHQQRRFQWK
jgi:hypothetical protein